MMREYLEEDIEDFAEDIVSKTTSSAQKGMSSVDYHSDKLGKVKADRPHIITENLLYVSNRVRLDITLAIYFLCTRVSESTVHDWRKSKRALKYLKGLYICREF